MSYVGPDGRAVRQMFGAIAHRYDSLNHLLSASIDRYWRRQAVRLIADHAPDPRDLCLDVCTGTGDLALEISTRLKLRTIGSDFCHPMLQESLRKIQSHGVGARLQVIEADTLNLPFPDSTFRFVTAAFGIRNVESLESGIQEMYRVLAPGGVAVILEFSKPVIPGFRHVFDAYFTHILPRIGRWVSGVDGPYQYLPASVGRFPGPRQFESMISSTGFQDVGYRNLTGGVAALHWGTKPGSA